MTLGFLLLQMVLGMRLLLLVQQLMEMLLGLIMKLLFLELILGIMLPGISTAWAGNNFISCWCCNYFRFNWEC